MSANQPGLIALPNSPNVTVKLSGPILCTWYNPSEF